MRRTVRAFSSEPVPIELVENAIATAGTAPSGAHQQPWTFVVVCDSGVKRRIREAAEEEERRSYEGRMPDEWLRALEPLGTDWRKPHIEEAPYLVAVFEQAYGLQADGSKVKHYYVKESVGIAVGLMLASLHEAPDPGREIGRGGQSGMRSEQGRRSTHVLQPADLGQYLREPPGPLGVGREQQRARHDPPQPERLR